MAVDSRSNASESRDEELEFRSPHFRNHNQPLNPWAHRTNSQLFDRPQSVPASHSLAKEPERIPDNVHAVTKR